MPEVTTEQWMSRAQVEQVLRGPDPGAVVDLVRQTDIPLSEAQVDALVHHPAASVREAIVERAGWDMSEAQIARLVNDPDARVREAMSCVMEEAGSSLCPR